MREQVTLNTPPREIQKIDFIWTPYRSLTIVDFAPFIKAEFHIP
jgi:hypothetical protein